MQLMFVSILNVIYLYEHLINTQQHFMNNFLIFFIVCLLKEIGRECLREFYV
jgi:hypothetical protein